MNPPSHTFEKVRLWHKLRSNGQGFSLVEILVSIAILAILAAFLVSLTAKMRELGNRSVCVNNLKQIAMAWQGYLAENRYLFPEDMGTRTPMPDGGNYWGYWMYGGGEGISSEPYSASTNRWLSPYLPAGKVWRCPSDGKGLGKSGVHHTMYGNSYPWNVYGLSGHGEHWTWSRLEMTNASRKYLVSDPAILMKPPAWSYETGETHTRGPNARFNMAFVDGHVAWVQDDESKTPTGAIIPGSAAENNHRTRDFDW